MLSPYSRGAPDPETCAAARYLGRTLAETELQETAVKSRIDG